MNAEAAVLPTKRLGTLEQIYLSFFWFSSNAHWGALLTVLVQSQVWVMVGDSRKAFGAGLVTSIGSITGILVPPLVGAWSDRVKFRIGRRRPFMVFGTLANLAALVGLATFPFMDMRTNLWGFAGAYWLYVGAYLVANLTNNFATAPYTALLPDIVPKEQRGSASGWYGLMTLLGNGVGIVIGGTVNHDAAPADFQGQIYRAYSVLGTLLVVGALITILGTREQQFTGEVKPLRLGDIFRGVVEPFRSKDFKWVFITRMLVTTGVITVQANLQFYMADAVKTFTVFGKTLATTSEEAVRNLLALLLLASLPSTLIAGRLSDRFGRKKMVYIAGGIQAAVALGLILFDSYLAGLIIGLLFGIGYGAYESVDWALATDVLPNADDAAKDMGVWHMSYTIPQLIATPIAGWLLDTFQTIGKASGRPTLGYTVIFSIAVVYFVVGTFLIRKVEKAR